MSDTVCKEAQAIRQEVYRVSRERLAAILAAPVENRAALVAAAKTDLLARRNVALSQLPAGGCQGVRCLAPFFDSVNVRMEASVRQPGQRQVTREFRLERRW